MNERIRELKHQASVWCDENIPEQFSEETNGYGSAWEDKLAELIVQECARVCLSQRDPANLNYKPSERFAEAVKQHFGVEK